MIIDQEDTMSGMTSVPEDFDLQQFFADIKTIAVVGYSDNPERAGHYVAQYLISQGYAVTAVNPKYGPEVDGLVNHKSLAGIPAGSEFDVIDVFRAPQFAPDLVRQAAAMVPKPKYIVFQPGAESAEGAQIAHEHGIIPLDLCMMAAHKIWK
jgi:uncharacterized protein